MLPSLRGVDQWWILCKIVTWMTSFVLGILLAQKLIVVLSSQHDENMSLNRNRTVTRARASTQAPNNGGTYSRGSSQGTERNYEIRSLEQEERKANAVIIGVRSLFCCAGMAMNVHARAAIKVGLISASLFWRIIYNFWNLARGVEKTTQSLDLFAAISSHISGTNYLTSPGVTAPLTPHAPDSVLAPSRSDLLQENLYWGTSIVLGLTTITVTVVIKTIIWDHRAVLQCHGRPGPARMQESLTEEEMKTFLSCFRSVATDSMYRLSQVFLVVLFFGNANFFLFPVDPTILIPTVICGLIYVFDVIGPTRGSE